MSHLLQMRGLKQEELKEKMAGLDVASFTDAWIETRHPPYAANKRKC